MLSTWIPTLNLLSVLSAHPCDGKQINLSSSHTEADSWRLMSLPHSVTGLFNLADTGICEIGGKNNMHDTISWIIRERNCCSNNNNNKTTMVFLWKNIAFPTLSIICFLGFMLVICREKMPCYSHFCGCTIMTARTHMPGFSVTVTSELSQVMLNHLCLAAVVSKYWAAKHETSHIKYEKHKDSGRGAGQSCELSPLNK